MSIRQIAQDGRSFAVIALAAEVTSAGVGGVRGAAGMAIGITAAGFGAYILWQIILITGKAVTEGASISAATILTVMGFFLKVPLLLLANLAATRLGGAAPTCFLTGVVLVYFGLVAWGAARS